MKKYLSLAFASMLILGACSDDNKEPNPGPEPGPTPETVTATFGTPQANASYNAADNTYSWSSNTENYLPVFEFNDGQLAQYETLTFTIANLSAGSSVQMLYGINGQYAPFKMGRAGDEITQAGTVVIDLTIQNINLASVDEVVLSGQSETGTGSVEIKESDTFLSKEAETPEPENPGIATGKGTITFGYCLKEINYTTGMNSAGSSGTIGGAMYIPASMAADWKGNQLTGVNIGFGYSKTPEVEIFISEGFLDGDEMPTPVYTQTAEMYLPNDWNEVTLDTPYEITGKGFFIGYTTSVTFGDYPLGLDQNYSSQDDYNAGNFDNGSWIGVNNQWANGGPWFGDVTLQIQITGDALPLYTIAVSDLYIPSFVPQNYEFPMDFLLNNTGLDAVDNVTLSIKVNGTEVSQVVAYPNSGNSIASGESDWFTAYGISIPQTGTNMNVSVQVVKINGNAGISGQPVMTGITSVSELSYEKNVLFEEFTSQWCTWCPRGIVGMEEMEDNYSDQGFIGIAGHMDFQGTPDEMTSPTYVKFVETVSGGAIPRAVADRTYLFNAEPQDFVMYFDYQKQYPSYAQITLNATYNEATGSVDVESETEFALDSNQTYQLSFVLCENNVGPYPQVNGYSGSRDEMGGWQNMGGIVNWTFQQVANYAKDPFGINNSLPTNIVKGTPYSYSVSLPAQTMNANPDKFDINNFYVVGMILRTDESGTSRVINSAKFNMNGENNVRSKASGSSKAKAAKINRGKIIESRIGFELQGPQKAQKASSPAPGILRNL